jgi:hypothetical protein
MPVTFSPASPPNMRRTTFSRFQIAHGIALLASVVALFAMRRADPDLWGYLSYGRYFIELGRPTAVDVFSYTCTQCTWIHFEWLAHVSLWLSYDIGGVAGLIAFKCAVGAICLWFLFSAVSRAGSIPAAWLPAYVLVLGIVPRYFLFRPQLYTFALLAVFVATIWKYLRGDGRIWFLAPLTALWANLHGGFLAGLGVVGLAIFLSAVRDRATEDQAGLSRRTLALAALLVAAALSSLANPQGWRLWTYLITEITHDTNRRFVAEWMPLLQSTDVWSKTTTLFLLTVLFTGGIAAERRGDAPLGIRPVWWLISCLPLTVMTLQSVRHVPVLAIWAAPILAAFVRPLISAPSPLSHAWGWLRVLMAVPIAITGVLVIQNPGLDIKLPARVLGSADPFGAVTYMQASRLSGNLYLPLWWGSYATAQLYPRVLVSMDGRNVSLYPREMVLESLLFFTSSAASLEVPWRYDTDYLLMPRDAPLFARIRADFRWRPQFEDEDVVLFARSSLSPEHVTCRYQRPSVFAFRYPAPVTDHMPCSVVSP